MTDYRSLDLVLADLQKKPDYLVELISVIALEGASSDLKKIETIKLNNIDLSVQQFNWKYVYIY